MCIYIYRERDIFVCTDHKDNGHNDNDIDIVAYLLSMLPEVCTHSAGDGHHQHRDFLYQLRHFGIPGTSYNFPIGRHGNVPHRIIYVYINIYIYIYTERDTHLHIYVYTYIYISYMYIYDFHPLPPMGSDTGNNLVTPSNLDTKFQL